jgi:hypothetical protein
MRFLDHLHADSPRYTPLGLFLALAMVPALGALALDERLFQGVPVWTKPLKFLFALVVYLLTLAWMARFAEPSMTQRAWWRWHERAVVVAVLAEMIWIGGAAAWGVPSHYNNSNLLMAVVYPMMGVAAIVLTTASTTLALAIHRHENTGLSPALKAGLVWGLGLTLPLTLVTAGTLSAMPGHWVGGTPSDVGGLALMGWSRDGGDLRVAHFFATHALHVIPLFALVADHLPGLPATWAVRGFAGLYVTLVILTFAQALAGQPFF